MRYFSKGTQIWLRFIVSVQKKHYATANVNEKIHFTPVFIMVVEMEVRQAAVEVKPLCALADPCPLFLPAVPPVTSSPTPHHTVMTPSTSV